MFAPLPHLSFYLRSPTVLSSYVSRTIVFFSPSVCNEVCRHKCRVLLYIGAPLYLLPPAPEFCPFL